MRDSADPGKPRVSVVAEQVGQREGQIEQIAGELAGGEVEHLSFRAHNARVGAQVPQCRHATLTDHPVGVLAHHAQHADHARLLVAQRAVGERVICLLGVARPLQDQHQGLVPGRLPG